MAARVFAYVDGFNLYFGLRDAGFERFLWLDIQLLAENIAHAGQQVVCVKYFTSRISGPSTNSNATQFKQVTAKRERQSRYLDALATRCKIKTYYGQFQDHDVQCRSCNSTWVKQKEKMTDVNIATELIVDAHSDAFDTALLISADSDLVPPVKAVRQLFPKKDVVVWFPPQRNSNSLKLAASSSFHIGKGTVAKSQLPDTVVNSRGHQLVRPPQWK